MIIRNIGAYCVATMLFLLAFTHAAANFNPGAREYPMVVSGLGVLLCGGLVLQTLLQHAKRKRDEKAMQVYEKEERKLVYTSKEIKSFIIAIIAIFVYLFLIPRLGYIVSTFLIMLSLLIVLKRERYVLYLFLTVLTCLMIHYIFGGMLNIFLPRGMFF